MVTWDPEQYAQASSVQAAWAKEVLGRLNLSGDEHILDLGCGNGKVTAEILGHVPSGSVTGIDSSAEMIRFARETYPPETYPGLSFYHADARTFSLDRKFHLIFSSATLHWIDDQMAVLKRIHRALLPGGRFIATTGGRGNAADLIASVTEVIKRPDWAPFFVDFASAYYFHRADEYFIWLKRAGLTPIRVALVPKDMVHEDRDALASWMRTTWMPYTQKVPEERREDFIGDALDHYINGHPVDENGATHVKMVRLEVEAVKE